MKVKNRWTVVERSEAFGTAFTHGLDFFIVVVVVVFQTKAPSLVVYLAKICSFTYPSRRCGKRHFLLLPHDGISCIYQHII